MRAPVIEIDLNELQEALLDFCAKKAMEQPDAVIVKSHSRQIYVELRPGGLVEADGAFKHRSNSMG